MTFPFKTQPSPWEFSSWKIVLQTSFLYSNYNFLSTLYLLFYLKVFCREGKRGRHGGAPLPSKMYRRMTFALLCEQTKITNQPHHPIIFISSRCYSVSSKLRSSAMFGVDKILIFRGLRFYNAYTVLYVYISIIHIQCTVMNVYILMYGGAVYFFLAGDDLQQREWIFCSSVMGQEA